MSISKRYFWVLACVFITAQAVGQVANSPFTQYGVGENYSNATANTQGMAGIGVSQPQTWYINNQNPALLIYNRYTTFQVGLLGESRSIRSATSSERTTGGNMNYIALAFPVVALKWTTSIGLMPYTSLKYNMAGIKSIDGTDKTQSVEEQGSGGLTQLYFSNGFKLNEEFAVGLKSTYLFGKLDKIYKYHPENGGGIINSTIEEQSIAKDFTFSAGGSYVKDSLWNKDYRLSVGFVYGLGADINTTFIQKESDLTSNGDTIAHSAVSTRTKGFMSIPSSITAGVSLSKGTKWVLGSEFTYQDWSSYKTSESTSDKLNQSWRVALGGEFTPDPLAMQGFLKRVTYRLGVSTEQCPILINNKKVMDSGINFGFSFPTGRSSLDLAFKFGKRGNKAESILEETYFKVFFGITFNDQWFIRRRFD